MINKYEKVSKRVKEKMEEFIQDEVKAGTKIPLSPSTVLEWFEEFEQIYGITE
jgi:hypothetical protein|tara:strand:+ start:637 stop:795 length:159 start_codon:yes stop_codon:yes gene_type:complete